MPCSRHLHVERVRYTIITNHCDAPEAIAMTSTKLGPRGETRDLDELFALINVLFA